MYGNANEVSKKKNHVCMHSCNLLFSLFVPDNSNTLPPKAAACNLLQHLAHFLRNPLQEPAVQEEKEKKNYWRPLVRPKGVFTLKCLSQMSLQSFYNQLLKTPEVWSMSKIKDQSHCFLPLLPHTINSGCDHMTSTHNTWLYSVSNKCLLKLIGKISISVTADLVKMNP